ncbi:MAG: hypothetical protein LBJ42_01265 [Holosporales bacterium]|jgi:hypothetical protein|nr:hypothetical protein [Holosporales bacterium]
MKMLMLIAMAGIITPSAYCCEDEDSGLLIAGSKALHGADYTDEEDSSTDIIPEPRHTTDATDAIAERGIFSMIISQSKSRVKKAAVKCNLEARASELLEWVRCPPQLVGVMRAIMLYKNPRYRCIEDELTHQSGWFRHGTEGVFRDAAHALRLESEYEGGKMTEDIIVSKGKVWYQNTDELEIGRILTQDQAETAIRGIDAGAVTKAELLAINPKTYTLAQKRITVNLYNMITPGAISTKGVSATVKKCVKNWYLHTWHFTPALVFVFNPDVYVPR